MNRLYVPPSVFWPSSAAVGAGAVFSGTPSPGVLVDIPAVKGIADCTNLLSMSPPSILQAFDIVSLSIAFSAFVSNSAALPSAPNLSASLSLLLSGDVVYTARQTTPSAQGPNSPAGTYFISGVFEGDLVNPIRVSARDRLGIGVSIASDQGANNGIQMIIGARYDTNVVHAVAAQSTVSYNVVDLPGRRRL